MFKKAGRVLTFVVMAAMLFTFCPVAVMAAWPSGFSDMPAVEYWSYDALTAAVENNLLNGSGGMLMPKGSLTRAQLAAIINRAFGAAEPASLAGFSDVPAEAWYAADMAKAVRMKTFRGDDTGRLRPEDIVTRQEAFYHHSQSVQVSRGRSGGAEWIL